jgi:hypothetical protein
VVALHWAYSGKSQNLRSFSHLSYDLRSFVEKIDFRLFAKQPVVGSDLGIDFLVYLS